MDSCSEEIQLVTFSFCSTRLWGRGNFFHFSCRGQFGGLKKCTLEKEEAERLASVTCLAAVTFSYKGRSLLFCKSIIGCPLSTANFFSIQHFSIDNFTFASIYICSPGSVVLEKSLAFIWRQEWDKLMPNACSQTYFKPLKKLCIMHKCSPPPSKWHSSLFNFFSPVLHTNIKGAYE